MRKILLALLLVGSLAFAIQPAEGWNVGSIGKYSPTGNANVTTEGGNVTNLNLSGNISTEKWAGYWGNVTGRILLTPGPASQLFYSWAWDSSRGGEVCAIAASSGFDWSALQSTTAAYVDSIWGFGAATDNATNTYTANTCDLTIAGIAVTNTAGNTTGVGGFESCVVADQAAPAAKQDLAFCVKIDQNGNLFNGQTGDYELLAPTNMTAGAYETHYFWLELD